MSQKNYVQRSSKAIDFTADLVKQEEILLRLGKLKDGDTLCHGDFHPGNILLVDGHAVAIDFMNICRGNFLYDVITVSANVGSGKQEKEIFLKTADNLNVTADECVFIDNQEKNLVIPVQLGMKVIFYNHEEKNIGKLLKQLRNLYIDI